MTVLTFTQADGLYTNGIVSQTDQVSVEDNKLKIDTLTTTNDTRILFNSSADGTFSADISMADGETGPSSNVGVVFRAVDLDNGWHAFCNFSQNRIRLVKLVSGSGTIVYEEVLSGVYGISEARSMSVECSGDQIVLKQGASTLYTHTDTTFQDATLAGVRVGNLNYRIDNLTFPDAASAASKTVTFALGSDIQGATDATYIVSSVPLGASITNGNLDASGTTVTIDLDAFTSISAGTQLMFIATDKQTADDDADAISWDVATVVEV